MVVPCVFRDVQKLYSSGILKKAKTKQLTRAAGFPRVRLRHVFPRILSVSFAACLIHQSRLELVLSLGLGSWLPGESQHDHLSLIPRSLAIDNAGALTRRWRRCP